MEAPECLTINRAVEYSFTSRTKCHQVVASSLLRYQTFKISLEFIRQASVSVHLRRVSLHYYRYFFQFREFHRISIHRRIRKARAINSNVSNACARCTPFSLNLFCNNAGCTPKKKDGYLQFCDFTDLYQIHSRFVR